MNDDMKQQGGFALKAVVVVLAAIVVMFFAKIWIVDPLMSAHEAKEGPEASEEPYEKKWDDAARQPEKNWSKFKKKIDWKNAGDYIDQYVEVEGTVVSSHKTEKICYLNFDKDYKRYMALIIFAGSFKKFPDNPEKYYMGKKVKVEGRVKEYKGRLEIVLGSPEQIKLLE